MYFFSKAKTLKILKFHYIPHLVYPDSSPRIMISSINLHITNKKNEFLDQRDSTVYMVLALHVVGPTSIPSVSCSPEHSQECFLITEPGLSPKQC